MADILDIGIDYVLGVPIHFVVDMAFYYIQGILVSSSIVVDNIGIILLHVSVVLL